MPAVLVFGRLRQGDQEFESSLDCTERLSWKKKQKAYFFLWLSAQF